MMKPITPEQAAEMTRTVVTRSDSYIAFAREVAIATGDALAYRVYDDEIARRMFANLRPLDPVPTWDQVNPGM
jgi:hypothetical protein